MKITQLPNATAVTETDIAVIVQEGETRQIPRTLFAPTPPDGLQLDGNTLCLTENGVPVGTGAELPTVTVDAELSAVSENPVQNKAVKAYVDGERLHKIVDCPAFTNQPTVVGGLHEDFKPWNETYYYVHILDSASGTFQLMALKNDTSTIIDQTFTLADLNTGNSGTLKENSPIDFMFVGSDWQMRSAGVSVISAFLQGAKNISIQLSGYSNNSGYFHICYLDGFKDSDYIYSGTLTSFYNGANGFLFSNTNISAKNVFVSFDANLQVGQKTMNVYGTCSSQKAKDDNMFASDGSKNVIPINGVCWREGFADFEKDCISNFQIRIDGIFRNGFEFEVTGRK